MGDDVSQQMSEGQKYFSRKLQHVRVVREVPDSGHIGPETSLYL